MKQISAILLVVALSLTGCQDLLGDDETPPTEEEIVEVLEEKQEEEEEEEVSYEGDECSDGADNDRDGLFDCDDEGCSGSSICKENDEEEYPSYTIHLVDAGDFTATGTLQWGADLSADGSFPRAGGDFVSLSLTIDEITYNETMDNAYFEEYGTNPDMEYEVENGQLVRFDAVLEPTEVDGHPMETMLQFGAINTGDGGLSSDRWMMGMMYENEGTYTITPVGEENNQGEENNEEEEEVHDPIRLEPQESAIYFNELPEEYTIFAYTIGNEEGMYANSYGPYFTNGDQQIVIGAIENGKLYYTEEDEMGEVVKHARVWFTGENYIKNVHDYIVELEVIRDAGHGGLNYMDQVGYIWDDKQLDFIVWAVEEEAVLRDSHRGQDYGTGHDSCDAAHNFEFSSYDNGEMVDYELYDFYGNYVIIDVGAVWCGPCQAAAVLLQEFWEENDRSDITVIQFLLDNSNHDPPEKDDLKEWAEEFGVTHYLAGRNGEIYNYISEHFGESWSIPFFIVLGPSSVNENDMIVIGVMDGYEFHSFSEDLEAGDYDCADFKHENGDEWEDDEEEGNDGLVKTVVEQPCKLRVNYYDYHNLFENMEDETLADFAHNYDKPEWCNNEGESHEMYDEFDYWEFIGFEDGHESSDDDEFFNEEGNDKWIWSPSTDGEWDDEWPYEAVELSLADDNWGQYTFFNYTVLDDLAGGELESLMEDDENGIFSTYEGSLLSGENIIYWANPATLVFGGGYQVIVKVNNDFACAFLTNKEDSEEPALTYGIPLECWRYEVINDEIDGEAISMIYAKPYYNWFIDNNQLHFDWWELQYDDEDDDEGEDIEFLLEAFDYEATDTDADDEDDTITIYYDVDSDCECEQTVYVFLDVFDNETGEEVQLGEEAAEHVIFWSEDDEFSQSWTASEDGNYDISLWMVGDPDDWENTYLGHIVLENVFLSAADDDDGETAAIWFAGESGFDYVLSDTNDDAVDDTITIYYEPDTDCECEVDIRVVILVTYSDDDEVVTSLTLYYTIYEDELDEFEYSWTADDESDYDFQVMLFYDDGEEEAEYQDDFMIYDIYLEAGEQDEP